MAAEGAFSWNSELPSGRNPFWIRDEALAGLGIHAGDAVSVDTRAEPQNDDIVVFEAELEGDSVRGARRYTLSTTAADIRLDAVADGFEPLLLPADSVIVMGVVVARLRFGAGSDEVIEEPIERPARPE